MLQKDAKELLAWYDRAKRDLPWRESLEPYSVAVSELMLQQTTVAAVKPKFLAWMMRFPSIEKLAAASLEEVMEAWSGLGYYQRARRLREAAVAVLERGGFPSTYEGLMELPGFGPYTAAAVASICFERPVLAIDTNVIRVLFRYYALSHSAQDRKAHSLLRDNMASVLEWSAPGELNQALMELGAGICSINEPGCLLCPIRAGCLGRREPGGPEKFPLPKPKKEIKKTAGRVFLLRRETDQKLLMVKGTSLGLLGELYQPPIHFGDRTESNALSRFGDWLCQLLESVASVGGDWSLSYGISGRKLLLTGTSWLLESSPTARLEQELLSLKIGYKWVAVEEVEKGSDRKLPFSTLTRRVLKKWPESL